MPDEQPLYIQSELVTLRIFGRFARLVSPDAGPLSDCPIVDQDAANAVLRRQLLKGLTIFAAVCMDRESHVAFRKHRQHGNRRSSVARVNRSIFAKGLDGCRLAGLLGRFPNPKAGRGHEIETRSYGASQHRVVATAEAYSV